MLTWSNKPDARPNNRHRTQVRAVVAVRFDDIPAFNARMIEEFEEGRRPVSGTD